MSIAERVRQIPAISVSAVPMLDAEQDAREEAEQASRAKDEFLAILSHELPREA